ncbi:hypothetical protein MKZ20_14805 [Psychrobacillus sp. FSL K6-2684]|uniref:hypothetical protein n=1 Tax=Psychrobacillus sp. FSL K6-2684 TaxID=2921547 RepID=UPI0030F560C0
MAAIWVTRNSLIGNTGNLIGYKSGLGLTFDEFCDIMPPEFHGIWFGDENDLLRVRAEEYEELIATLLYKLGNTKEPYNPLISANYLKYQKENPEIFSIFQDLFKSFTDLISNSVREFRTNSAKSNLINPIPFIESAEKKYGIKGKFIAVDIIERNLFHQHISPQDENK